MGFFEKAKKAAKKLKEGVNELIDEVKERPKFYTAVEKLISEIEAIEDNAKFKADPEVQDALKAATALRRSLEEAKEAFDNAAPIHNLTGPDSMSGHEYYAALHKFCETSVNAIHKHQSTLMAAPGIWNKLKACINNVLEEYLGIKDALEIKESKIATKDQFKNRFDEVKSQGKENMKKIEEAPLRPNIK